MRRGGNRAWLGAGAAATAIAIVGSVLAAGNSSVPASQPEAAPVNALLPTSLADGNAPRPDIVLIVTDDQPVGYEPYMPKMTRMFEREGVAYTNAHSLTSTCCPARATLLTGKDSPTTGVWSNWAPVGGWEVFRANQWEPRTLATALDRRGYRTALIGKYLNGYETGSGRTSTTGEARWIPPGWDYWFAESTGVGEERGRYFNYRVLFQDETMPGPEILSFGSGPEDYATDVLGRRVTDVIRSTPTGTPLFLMWTPGAPHSPFSPGPGSRRVTPKPELPVAFNDTRGKPPWISGRPPAKPAAVNRLMAGQIRTLQIVDDWVASIVTTLKKTGRWDNTILVFVSDNGIFLGQYGLVGMKNHPHPPSTHVPLYVAAPFLRDRAGERDGRLVTLADIPATFAAAAGLDGDTMDGLSLNTPLSLWRSGALVAGWRNRGKAPAGNQPAYCAWRTDTRLFIQYSANNDGEGFRELYDLTADPHARRNLAGIPDYAAEEADLARQTQAACRPAPPDFAWPDTVVVPTSSQ
jgi:N-acetylglucosamine-6-sulfatase